MGVGIPNGQIISARWRQLMMTIASGPFSQPVEAPVTRNRQWLNEDRLQNTISNPGSIGLSNG